MLEFDHIAVAAETLEEGVEWVRECLGITVPKGGSHPLMGTHNHLVQLGAQAFLEIIAVDPEARVHRERWFELDHFSGPPCIKAWIARCTGIGKVLDELAVDVGVPVDLTRGDLQWQLSVRDDGSLPFEGVFPSIIQWPEGQFPVPNMTSLGCEMFKLHLEHPNVDDLQRHLERIIDDERIDYAYASAPRIWCEIKTPAGVKTLG